MLGAYLQIYSPLLALLGGFLVFESRDFDRKIWLAGTCSLFAVIATAGVFASLHLLVTDPSLLEPKVMYGDEGLFDTLSPGFLGNTSKNLAFLLFSSNLLIIFAYGAIVSAWPWRQFAHVRFVLGQIFIATGAVFASFGTLLSTYS